MTVAGPDGRRVLPAFTSADAMRAWNPVARPDPDRGGPDRARGAASEGTPLIVVDPKSPTEIVIRRTAFRALATGRPLGAVLRGRAVLDAFLAAAEDEPVVRAVQLAPGDPDARLAGAELLVQLVARRAASTGRARRPARAPADAAGRRRPDDRDSRRLDRAWRLESRPRSRALERSRPGRSTSRRGPCRARSGNGEASRNASCTVRSPSRSARAWCRRGGERPLSTRPARASMSLRASSRSSAHPVFGETDLHGGGAQQVHGDGVDHLDGRDLRDVPDLLARPVLIERGAHRSCDRKRQVQVRDPLLFLCGLRGHRPGNRSGESSHPSTAS